MEVILIIGLFFINAFALDCLYNKRYKTVGAMLILNLCLTIVLAYQFEQITKIIYIFVALIALIVVAFGVKFYLGKKKVVDKEHRIGEE